MDPQQRQVAKEFDSYRHSYADAVNDAIGVPGLKVDFFTRVKAGYIVDLARTHFGDASRLKVLDLGCGVGNYHGLLQHSFNELHGVDVSAACIEEAASRYPGVEYRVYDGSRLPYPDASFDLAYTVCVMHHVPERNWPEFVAEMHRVLRPGGLALVFEHNPRNPLTRHVVDRCPFDADAVLLPGRQTVGLFERCRFEKVQLRYILNIPAANRPLRLLDRLLSGLGVGAQYYVSARRAQTGSD